MFCQMTNALGKFLSEQKSRIFIFGIFYTTTPRPTWNVRDGAGMENRSKMRLERDFSWRGLGQTCPEQRYSLKLGK
jgi:hypothetical protein